MSSQPCSSQDFLEVNQSKEYTLIATTILESVLTDTRLNAQSIKLWQLLFNQARYNPNFDIKISYSYLSKKLGKSIRTIARYVETLQNAGYLIITHNFDKNGGQRPNTISVRVPEFSIRHAKKKKDRHHKNNSNNNVLLIDSANEPIDSLEISNENFCKNKTDLISSNIPDLINNVLHGTNEKTSNNLIEKDKNDRPPINIPKEKLMTEEPLTHITQDKIVMGGHDINDIQKDNNKKDLNKNNNKTVVVSSHQITAKLSKLNELQNKIKQIQKAILEGNDKLINLKDHALMYNQIRKNSELEAALHLSKIAMERLHNEMDIMKKELEVSDNMANDTGFMISRIGERSFTNRSFQRLVKILKTLGYSGNHLNSLINEIVFEIRFGSLINCNKTKKELSIDNAVNIALKLVREHRWSTPTLLKKSERIDAVRELPYSYKNLIENVASGEK